MRILLRLIQVFATGTSLIWGPAAIAQEGAYADLLLVDGNPLEDLNLVADPDKNLSSS